MMKKLCIILLLAPILVLGQKPYINNISPTHVEVGQRVTISGLNLGGQVFFGAVESPTVTGSGNTITAVVPAGATHGPITVLNNSLVAQSTQQFFISFSGTNIADYDPEYLVSSGETDAFDICMCDLNDDGKNDIIMAHNVQSSDNSGNEISVYTNNTSGIGGFTTEFSSPDLINNPINFQGAIAVTCGDLNNDGLPEMIFSSNSGSFAKEVYVYENQSTSGGPITLTFRNDASQALPQAPGNINRVARKVRVADVDGDGNMDLVVGNEVDATIHIFRGNGDLTFDTFEEISVGSASRTSSVEVADLNNDGRPDIAIVPFRVSNERIYVLKNNSVPDNVSFSLQGGITTPAQRINIASADFDEDGLIDIVITNQVAQRVTVHRNTSTGSDILFDAGTNIPMTGAGPWGIDIGDMNGDGKPDLIVGSTSAIDQVFVIQNNSSSGSFSFATPTAINATNTNQNVCVGDLNNDARPDIAFTHNIQPGNPGNMAVFLNRNCVVPVINPNNLEFCNNETFTLNATKSLGGTYTWEIIAGDGTNPTDTDSEADFVIPSASSATIRVTLNQGGCSEQATADFTLLGGTQPTPPTFSPTTETVCFGDDFDITASLSGTPPYELTWTLPDGSTFDNTSSSNSAVLPLTNLDFADDGIYTVRAKESGGCFSDQSAEFTLVVSQPPTFEIFNNNLDIFCSSSSITLEVPDLSSNFTYQWRRNGTSITGETNATLVVSQSGEYSVAITDQTPDACQIITTSYPVTAISDPVSDISGPLETCVNFETSFSAASTGQSGFDLQYSWIVDGTPVTPANPDELLFTFNTTGAHTVTLVTSYDPELVELCSDAITINVNVAEEPTITFDQVDLVPKCQAEALTIGLTSPAESSVVSYQWSLRNALTNELISTSTGNTLEVSTPIGVDTVYAVVNVITDIGCEIRGSIRVRNFDTDIDITSLDFSSILEFDTAILEDASSIRLTAANVTNVSWEPAENFNDPNGIDVEFFPQSTTTTVTMTGTDTNGCLASSEVRIILDNLRPKKTFSPNGDGLNDCWEILNIGDQGVAGGCKIYIFDSRGRTILQKEEFPDENCVWDGNFQSSPVQEGVYYFVLNCGNEQLSKTGSILLAR